MTNILASVLITVSTNWIPLYEIEPVLANEEYRLLVPPISGGIVEGGFYKTNMAAIFDWKGDRKEIALESQLGPVFIYRTNANALRTFYATNFLSPSYRIYSNILIQTFDRALVQPVDRLFKNSAILLP